MEKKLQLNFILPYKPKRPAGGFKVMFEYANRLAQKGHAVHLYFPLKTPLMKYRLPTIARLVLSKVEGFNTHKWFQFEPSIGMSYVTEVEDKNIRDADITIATWWTTASEMAKLSSCKGKKINLIQGFENWEGHEDLLYKSYDMKDTTNVVVASYLKEIVQKHTDKKAIVITNAIDATEYNVAIPIERRQVGTVCMLYSEQEIKGSKYGLEALKLVKEKYPNLVVNLFGVHAEPENLPDWMSYHHDPKNLVEIYNKNAIFVANSFTEGMALTPLEALFCGCALVCTDIDGHKEYAFEGETALLVETKNPQMLADKIAYLIENDAERILLAKRGNAYAQRFSWDLAVEKMEKLMLSL